MDSVYIAIAVFVIIAMFEPISIILSSIAIRRTDDSNSVKLDNYESTEKSVGKRLSIMTEYLPYFPMFLMYEVIIAVMLIWVLLARVLPQTMDFILFGLFAFGFIMEISIIKIARVNDE